MRSIVGVQRIEAGQVEVFGQEAGSAPLRPRIGYVTQDPSVYGDLSVAENIRYFASVVGVPRSRLDGEVARVLETVGLTDAADQEVAKTSGGQTSRVSLGAALVGTPELLVLDEPTVGLDPVLRRDLWTIFRRLAEQGVTLLVSSHVMDEAARCDRLLLMRAGRFLADDTQEGVLAATGAADVEQAFLALVDQAARRDGTPAGPPAAHRHPAHRAGPAANPGTDPDDQTHSHDETQRSTP
jgi:ABC-2 type transport system ATP-binding protein